MLQPNNVAELNKAISLLEAQQANEWEALKSQYHITYDSLKPINFIKNTIVELTKIPDFNGDLLDTTISLAAGYVSKEAIVGTTHNPIKQLLGTLLQIGITNLVSKNTDGIKSVVGSIIHAIFNKKHSTSE